MQTPKDHPVKPCYSKHQPERKLATESKVATYGQNHYLAEGYRWRTAREAVCRDELRLFPREPRVEVTPSTTPSKILFST